MDGMVATQEPTGFVGWIMEYGQIVAFVAQMAYWLLMIVLLAYAVWQYKRWVNFQLGVGRSGKLNPAMNADVADDDAAATEAAVSVEEFVE